VIDRASESAAPIDFESLRGGRLEAIAAIWRRERRQLAARFGGVSMEPTIAPSAEVLLQCGVHPGPGEIAAFTVANRILVHRVMARSPAGTWLLTRGDANAIPDPPISDIALIGTVVRVRHGDQFVEPPGPPTSRGRRVTLALCLLGLRANPRVGRHLIQLLWFLRRWFVLAPRAVIRRVRAISSRRGS
jgi:hypothetical protein